MNIFAEWVCLGSMHLTEKAKQDKLKLVEGAKRDNER